ncbi:hypothetical protein [Magnetofaba australis]|nr:hypothetical protein [Magnetofaba australis]
MTNDGEVIVMVNTSSGNPALAMSVRAPSGLSLADSAGTYHYVWAENVPATSYGTITLDGAGSGTWSQSVSSTGSLSSGTLTYSLSSDGVFTATQSNGYELKGAFNSDLSVLTYYSSALLNNTYKGFGVAGKQGSSLSASNVLGDYYYMGYVKSPASIFGQFTADGKGGYSGLSKLEGTSSSAFATTSGSYTISSSGKFTSTTMISGYNGVGFITPDGSFMAMVDTDISDNSISISTAIRKSQ